MHSLCEFDVYTQTCTSREYFKKQGYLENYAPSQQFLEKNRQLTPNAISLMQAMENCRGSDCYGYLYSGGRFTGFSSQSAEYFCQKENYLVIDSESYNYFEKHCQDFPSESTESVEFGWMPYVNYTHADSRDQCSYNTPLNGYYSWNGKECGILDVDGHFCKLSGSDFIAYSKEKEYSDKGCKPIKGSSFLLLRFLP